MQFIHGSEQLPAEKGATVILAPKRSIAPLDDREKTSNIKGIRELLEKRAALARYVGQHAIKSRPGTAWPGLLLGAVFVYPGVKYSGKIAPSSQGVAGSPLPISLSASAKRRGALLMRMAKATQGEDHLLTKPFRKQRQVQGQVQKRLQRPQHQQQQPRLTAAIARTPEKERVSCASAGPQAAAASLLTVMKSSQLQQLE
jgi:hypothetical protein